MIRYALVISYSAAQRLAEFMGLVPFSISPFLSVFAFCLACIPGLGVEMITAEYGRCATRVAGGGGQRGERWTP